MLLKKSQIKELVLTLRIRLHRKCAYETKELSMDQNQLYNISPAASNAIERTMRPSPVVTLRDAIGGRLQKSTGDAR